MVASQPFCPHWVQLDLFEPPKGPETSRKRPSNGESSSKGPSRKSAETSPNAFEMRMVAVGASGMAVGEDSPRARYSNVEIEFVFRLREEGMSYGEIARALDMPKSTVWAIAAGLIRNKVVDRWERRKCRR